MLILNPDAYRHLLRPLLFRLDPETAQRTADLALKAEGIWRLAAPALRVSDARLKTELSGLSLDNPIGLAAGYDKDCAFLPSLAALGFGYVVGGTVTLSPRPGNPRPRVIRYPREESLVNALGFPSRGLEYAAKRMEAARRRGVGAPALVSVSGVAIDEIVGCHRRLEPLSDGVEINISSPNTAGLRLFQEPEALDGLLDRVNDGRRGRLFVKLPPYGPFEGETGPAVRSGSGEATTDGGASREQVMGLVETCLRRGVDGLTVANTRPVRDPRLAVGAGGLSGGLLFEDTLRMVSDVREAVGDRAAINACGGISSGRQASQALEAGATTVQLLTGLDLPRPRHRKAHQPGASNARRRSGVGRQPSRCWARYTLPVRGSASNRIASLSWTPASGEVRMGGTVVSGVGRNAREATPSQSPPASAAERCTNRGRRHHAQAECPLSPPRDSRLRGNDG